jgi:acyl-CoA reductase-like NAD-dependent aldehyde dehydrogenase
MAVIRDDEVRAIIERAERRVGREGGAAARSGQPPARAPRRPARGREAAETGEGIHASVNAAVAATLKAFRAFTGSGLAQRYSIVESIRTAMREHGRELARMAHEETGLGRFEDKIVKNQLVTEKTPGPEDLEPVVRTGDDGMMVTEYAPFGVVGAITPTTNPTSTIINNTIAIVSAGNGVVFNVHPNARKVSIENVRLINRAIVSAGGPPDLVSAVATPTVASAQELMKHPDVRILMITGGPGVVAEARRSGKRAILAGPGNPPAVVDETADIELAAREIVLGASFDNNLICIDEKECIVVDAVADDLLRAMGRSGALVLKPYQLKQLERVIFTEPGVPGKPAKVNPRWIGKNAGVILAEIGVRAGDDVRLAVAEVPADHPLFWTEQMMPVFPVVRVPTVGEAIDLAIKVERGCCHTASIYSRNVDTITTMARRSNVSIFVVNSANRAGLGAGGEGFTSFSIASPTGEGLTRPRSFSRERRLTVVGGLRIV